MESERLRYFRLEASDVARFLQLAQDSHIRRYLMDGQIVFREWSAQRIRDSQSLFERRGVGIWLAIDKWSHELLGFCGFMEILPVHPEPQLVYALLERFTGKGYATEMGLASITQARTQDGFATIFAGVDEVNAASVRVLEKLGFKRISTQQGTFGNMFLFRLDDPVHISM